MKSKSILRILRIFFATVIIIPFTFLFIDFGRSELREIWVLSEIQIVPAFMTLISGALGALLLLLVLFLITLLFGRIYCSVLCPFGIMQDVIASIFNEGKKKNKRKKYKYSAPTNILRYSILAAVVISIIAGFSFLLSWIDPYSNFGKIARNIFGFLYREANNVLASNGFDSLYHVSLKSFELFSIGFSIALLLIIGVMVFFRGRLFCNTICPTGAFLSLISRFSIFKLKLDSEKCNSCGLCTMRCKSECIDSKNKTLDFSRCVTCYNCIGTCNKNAIGYKFSWKKSQTSENLTPVKENMDINKRRFIATSSLMLGSLVVAAQKRATNGKTDYKKLSPIAPPGAKSIKNLLSKCTACHLCISQCPTQVLRPAFMEYGFAGIMMPVMDYDKNFCNFECTLCSRVCPNEAIQSLTTKQKMETKIGDVFFIKELCVVYTDETSCGACSEHCPTKAVDMVHYKDNLTIPKINQDICIGCGGCEYICPVRPLRAIYIDGNPVHQVAQRPDVGEKQKIDLDGFGF